MKNSLYYGDNLEVLRKHIRDETVDLVYIDPPSSSKRYYNQIYNNIGREEDRAGASLRRYVGNARQLFTVNLKNH